MKADANKTHTLANREDMNGIIIMRILCILQLDIYWIY